MITQISTLSGNTVGFNLVGEITKEDYDNVIFPAVKKVTEKSDELNMMLVISTDLSNFTPGAWIKDAALGLKNLTKFHHVALVSDSLIVRSITSIANKLIPGEYKSFTLKDIDSAKAWVTEMAA